MDTFLIAIAVLTTITPSDDLDGLGGTDEQHRLAAEIADAYCLDSLLVWSIIQSESAWDSLARSSGYCLGLMQILPKYHGNFPDSLYFDQEFNLNVGCAYLVELLKMFDGNLEQALTGYNYGPYHKVTIKRRTSGYAREIKERINKWKSKNNVIG